MNSIKRRKQDEKISIEPLDTRSSVRVIHSHRRPSRMSLRRPTVFLIILAMLSPSMAAAVATPKPRTVSVPVATPSVAPLTFPPPPYVAPIPPPTEPPTANTGANARATRKAEPAPKPVSRVETAVRYALAQQGDPYRWARSGPNAYDCSGLVLAAFKQIGINLPHYTGTMINHGKRVARSALIRGDVVFPSSGHVGIYLGGGQFVHASSSRGRVTVGKLYSFYAARRLV